MSGQCVGPVEVDRAVVYALVVRTAAGVRLRLTADDWERLFLPVGARVEVGTGGTREPFFIRTTTYVDPGWQWVELVTAPPAPRRRDVRHGAGPAG